MSDNTDLKQQIVMRQVLRAGEITTRQLSDHPQEHVWEELDSAVHDIQYTLLALWGYNSIEQLMGPRESWKEVRNETISRTDREALREDVRREPRGD